MDPGKLPPSGRGGRRLWLEQLEERDLLAASPGLADSGNIHLQPGHYDPAHILVWYEPEVTPTAWLNGTTIGTKLDLVSGLYVVDLASGVSVARALKAYQAAPGVRDALPDYLLTIQKTPRDTYYSSSQWDLRRIQAPQAWNTITGSSSMVVAVIDSGIDYAHPDLARNIWINQAEIPSSRMAHLTDVDGDGVISFWDLNNPINQGQGKITDFNKDGKIDGRDLLAPLVKDSQGQDTGKGGWADGVSQHNDPTHRDDLIGWDFYNDDNKPMDDNGHGTHVAGTIGATGNNNLGVTGINWKVSLMPIKFMAKSGKGDLGAFLDGLGYAVANGARLANNSWVGFGESAYLRQMVSGAIAQAGSRGLIFVASAGNAGHNNDVTPIFPASFTLDNVVSVAATNSADNLAGFSDWGATTVDLAAPGVNIYSTLPGGRYGLMNGTSMATPHVTGALALVWSLHPTWTYQQVIDQVLSTVDRLPGLLHKTISGGRLNLARAVGLAATANPLVITTSSFSGPDAHSVQTVLLTFNQAIDPSSLTAATAALIGPEGVAVPPSAIQASGQGNTQLKLVFPLQTAAGTYALQIGAQVQTLSGQHLIPYAATFTVSASSAYANSQSLAIPDLGQASSPLTVNDDFAISTIRIQVKLTHSFDSDLVLVLLSPSGTEVTLSNRRGGAGQNYTNTVFDDSAATPIAQGQAPFAGSYQPEQALQGLQGQSAQGVWKLRVEDHGQGDVGTLISWSLTLGATSSSG